MTPTDKLICFHCIHLTKYGCEAFDEIPEEILSGENKHEKPLPNQKNDIVFEPKKDVSE